MRISDWSSDVCSSDLHEAFLIPDAVAAEWKKAGERSAGAHEAWQDRLASHSKNSEFERRMAGDLPADFSLSDYIDTLLAEPKKVATRKASEMALEAINVLLPETVGGSADLTGSNNTKTKSTERKSVCEGKRVSERV